MDLIKEKPSTDVPVKTTRMAAIVPKYTPLLYALLFFLLIDFIINSFSEFLVHIPIALLVIYIAQVLCVLFSALLVSIMLTNTYMAQAGLTRYMMWKFKSVWILTVIYVALMLALQIWTLTDRWDDAFSFVWHPGQIALYVLQRSWAILYYYIYKRTAYRLSDSRFYEDSEWLRKEFERRN